MKQFTSILKFCIAFLAFIVCMSVDAQGVILRKYVVAPGDESGTAVSLSGNSDIVAVGSRYSNAGGSWSGQVYVFNTYIEQIGGAINGASSDQSGSAISLNYSGTRIAIGAPFNNTNGLASGQVRILDWNVRHGFKLAIP